MTGITGQDGSYLAKLLLEKGYKVYGTSRRSSMLDTWRLQYLCIHDKVTMIPTDITNPSSFSKALKVSDPHEVYNFAANSFGIISPENSFDAFKINSLSVMTILNEIQEFDNKIKFFQAASSEMYGNERTKVKNEKTPFQPISIYGITKLAGFWCVRMFRDKHDIHCSNGILFNHESTIRGLEFVTRKISNGVARISLGLSSNLKLGNISAKRDWGYAPEYVEGAWRMLQQKNSGDYVLATNELHSVKEFIEESCKVAGISNTKVTISKEDVRESYIPYSCGDYTKAI